MNSSMIQPYFVMSNSKYYKAEVKDLGISHFYTFNKKGRKSCDMIAVPDGCIDILFKCDDHKPSANVCGSVLQAHNVILADETTYFGVRFYPGEGYEFKDVQSKEIINHEIPITHILDAKDMMEQIVTTKNFNAQIQIFMNHYTRSLHKSSMEATRLSMKNYMSRRIIESNGNLRINELAKEMGYSVRYINRKFIEFFGIQPKVFSKIIRFQHTLNHLNRTGKSSTDETLLQLAMDAGYYDQSHMIKDFNLLSSRTPSNYVKLLEETQYMKRLVVV